MFRRNHWSYVQVILEDGHDHSTLALCSPGDLRAAYDIPLGQAARLLQIVRNSKIAQTAWPNSLTCSTKVNTDRIRAIGLIGARAAVLLIQVRPSLLPF